MAISYSQISEVSQISMASISCSSLCTAWSQSSETLFRSLGKFCETHRSTCTGVAAGLQRTYYFSIVRNDTKGMDGEYVWRCHLGRSISFGEGHDSRVSTLFSGFLKILDNDGARSAWDFFNIVILRPTLHVGHV